MRRRPESPLARRSPVRAGCGGLILAFGISGCAVGPKFDTPAPPAADGYTAKAVPEQTAATAGPGGAAQSLHFGRDLPGQWWTLFGSADLDALIETAMSNYPDIAAQQAALRVARENARAQFGAFAPTVQGAMQQQRAEISGAAIAPGFPSFTTSIYQASVNVSYTFDIFGGERRQLEGLRAQVAYQNFQLEASYLTLTSNVAATAIALASVGEQIAVTHDIIEVEEKLLALIDRQFELGTRTRADVLQQRSNLASIRATLPALEQQYAVAEHQLGALTGRLPADAPAPNIHLKDLKLPEDLPVTLPSALVAQRPDIRAQEALMHQASAAVGVATANLLPQLTLTGAIGDESLLFGTLFQPGSAVWNFATNLTAPIIDGGTLRAKRRAALATYDQAAAQYRLTVINAFQNVADTLTALEHDAETLKAESDAVDAAEASLELIQRQYAAGAVNYESLLTAQQLYQQARIAQVRAVTSRYTDTVTLFQALGGGWWNRRDPGSMHGVS